MAEAACGPFFAKTPPAGSIDVDQRQEMLAAVVDIFPVESGRLVLLNSRGSSHLHLVVEGWLHRSATLLDGSRQITDILLPDDVCDWRAANLANESVDVRACGPALIAAVRRDVVEGSTCLQLRRAME